MTLEQTIKDAIDSINFSTNGEIRNMGKSIRGKYAIFKDGKMISDVFDSFGDALITAVHEGYYKIEPPAMYDRDKKQIKCTRRCFTYTSPIEPVCYEILQFVDVVYE